MSWHCAEHGAGHNPSTGLGTTIAGMGRGYHFRLQRPISSTLTRQIAIWITLASLAYHAVWWIVTWHMVLLYVPDLPVLFVLPFCVSIGIILAYRRAGDTGHVPQEISHGVTVAGVVILVTSCSLTYLWLLFPSYPFGEESATTRVGNTTYQAVMVRDEDYRQRYYLYACDSTGRLCNVKPLCLLHGYTNPTPAFAFDSQTSELVVLITGREIYRQDSVRARFPGDPGGCSDGFEGVPVKYPP